MTWQNYLTWLFEYTKENFHTLCILIFCVVLFRLKIWETEGPMVVQCPVPFVRFLTMAHVNTSDLPSRPLYWFHPRVARLSMIGRSQWPPHGHGTLCRNMFGTRLLFPSSAEIWRPVVVPWRDLTMYRTLSARPSFGADLSPCPGCYKLILITLYGGLAAAVRQRHLNNIHFY